MSMNLFCKYTIRFGIVCMAYHHRIKGTCFQKNNPDFLHPTLKPLPAGLEWKRLLLKRLKLLKALNVASWGGYPSRRDVACRVSTTGWRAHFCYAGRCPALLIEKAFSLNLTDIGRSLP